MITLDYTRSGIYRFSRSRLELFNCLLFPCLHFFTFFPHFQKAFFHIFFQAHFQNAFFFTFFTFVKKCVLKMHLDKMWKHINKCEQKTFENPVGKVELWFFSSGLIFWGTVLLQLLCCLPNFCRLKIGEEQFKSIGSGLCRSVWFTYSKTMTTRSKNIKSNAKGKENKASKLL